MSIKNAPRHNRSALSIRSAIPLSRRGRGRGVLSKEVLSRDNGNQKHLTRKGCRLLTLFDGTIIARIYWNCLHSFGISYTFLHSFEKTLDFSFSSLLSDYGRAYFAPANFTTPHLPRKNLPQTVSNGVKWNEQK